MRTVSFRDPWGFDNFVINFTIIISGSRLMPIFSDWVPSKYSVYGNLNLRIWSPKRKLTVIQPSCEHLRYLKNVYCTMTNYNKGQDTQTTFKTTS